MMSWSRRAAGLVHSKGVARWMGALGILAGQAPALGLIAVIVVGSAMDAGVVVGILLLQAVWNVTAGVVLLRSKSKDPETVRAVLQSSYSK